MSQSSAIRAGSAFVELFTKDNLLVSGLKAAQAKVKAFGSAIAGIGTQFATLGAAIWAPLLTAAHSFAESGSELLLLSQRTGISVEALSQLKYAAGQSGVATEDFETAIKKMSKTVQSAADGSHEARQSLASLGVTVHDLANLTPDEQFIRLGQGIAAIANPTTRAARALEVFGRGGTAILPMLSQGEEGIRRFMAEADRLGLTKSEESVQSAFRLQVAFKTAAKVVEGAWNAVGGAIAPVLTDAMNALLPVVASVRAWIKENRALFVTLAAIGGALVGIGSALLSVAGVVKLVGVALGPVITILGAGFAAAGFAIKLVLGYLMLFTTPLGILIVLFDVMKTYLLNTAIASTNTFGALKQGFSDVAGVATTTWGAIKDSIAAGDWAGALRVAWLGLQTAFEVAILNLKIAWREFSGFFVDVFDAAVNNVAHNIARSSDVWNRAVRNLALSGGLGAAEQQSAQALARQQAQFAENVRREVQAFQSANPGQALTPELQGRVDLMNRNTSGGVQTIDQTLTQMDNAQSQARARERAEATRADRERIAALQREIALEGEKASEKRIDAERMADYFANLERVTGGGAAGALDQSRSKVDVAGTFSAFAVGGLGASTLTERLLERIAENTATLPNLGLS